jgi:hypothetical protein
MKNKIFLYLIVVVSAVSCKERYYPDIVESGDSYLVVEGVLNAGQGATVIRLSRTAKLYASGFDPVLNAIVSVEGKDNSIQFLASSGNGNYQSPGLNLVINNEYRLRIKINNGKEYLSDYVIARNTPIIDSIGWRQNGDGVKLYVNTHDASENTHYYRWDYDETWEIRSYYYSEFIYAPPIVRERTPAENVSVCWKYDYSSAILIGSSARLQSDVIFEAPLLNIPTNNEKLAVRYSLLVRQYAIDKKGYEFYELMKKNTEQIGTVFDPQPSEVKGNIQCLSDPAEPVIGYVNASTISEKRIFVSRADLGDWHFAQDCPSVDIKNHPDSIYQAYVLEHLSPYAAVYSLSGAISAYSSSSKPCVECTARGGNLTRPSYW